MVGCNALLTVSEWLAQRLALRGRHNGAGKRDRAGEGGRTRLSAMQNVRWAVSRRVEDKNTSHAFSRNK